MTPLRPSAPGERIDRKTRVRHGLFLLSERTLTWCVNPYWRARLLRALGAKVGNNVRVYEARFFNLFTGFHNLTLEDDVHVGPGCLIDLSDRVVIGRGAVLSPRVTVLTHSDPGHHHGASLASVFPTYSAPVVIEENSWVGANAVLLAGAVVGRLAVVGANSLVRGSVDPKTVVGGSPARKIRDLDADLGAPVPDI
jgi:acetyltransferase-like isoleucine patch superfamily enzyme